MKIAALGDIHGNHVALEACLARIEREGVRSILFLGDYVTDCPYPEKTLALLREAQAAYDTVFLRGNREDLLLSYDARKDKTWRYGSRYGSLLRSYERLSAEELAWFQQMPISMTVSPDGTERFTICHGSPESNLCLLRPHSSEIEDAFARMQTGLLLCAHTHTPFVLEKDGKVIANGGSVGVPVTGGTDAEFLLLTYENQRWRPRCVRVAYDVEAAISEFYTSGFVEQANVWARAGIRTLRTGRNDHLACVELVRQYAREAGGSDDDERYWEMAAKTLGI